MIKNKKVTFILPAEIVANASHGLLLGEFNNWDKESGFSLKKAKDGSMKATIELQEGKSYEYRYLLDGGRWENDQTAEHYTQVQGFEIVNCVITIPVEEKLVEKKLKAKKAIASKTEKSSSKKLKEIPATKKSSEDLKKLKAPAKKLSSSLKGKK